MKSLILLGLVAVGLAQAAGADGYDTGVKGLHGIDLKPWNALLYSPVTASSRTVEIASWDNVGLEGVYQSILELARSTPLGTPKETLAFATKLFQLRHDLGKQPRTPVLNQTRELLEVLAEEVLYSAKVRFGNQVESVFRMNFVSASPAGFESRCQLINGINLCNGDVVISKGDAGSSGFIARSTYLAQDFSHSVLTYVKDQKVRFLEAEMESGVALNDPKATYVDKQKIRMFAYRYNGPDQPQLLGDMVSSMDTWVGSEQERLGNLDSKPIFKYDFNLNANDHSKVFCSEASYYRYDVGTPFTREHNPYPKTLWNQINGITAHFYNDLLTIPVRSYPAPGDVERNPEYELVGMTIDLNQLLQERIDVAMVDSFLALLEKNEGSVARMLGWVKSHGNQPVEKRWFQRWLVDTKIVSQEKFDRWTKDVPWGASRKQLAFFAWLNVRLTPSVRKALEAKEAESLATQKRGLDLHELRTLATQKVIDSNTILGCSLALE